MDRGALGDRAKTAARRGLAAVGVEVRRSRAGVRRSLPAVLSHYRQLGLAPATVFDVGVGAGTPELYDAFADARLVLVEPLEEWRSDLTVLERERGAEVVIAAAGREAGEIEIAVHRAPVCSSMLGARYGDGTEPFRRAVPLVRLDDLAQERQLAGPFVVKVDVEGGELEVLEGASEVLRSAELVLLEVSLFQFVEGAPQFAEVVGWMDAHGFAVADLYNAHNRPLDGALAQLDVAFIQTDGRFRTEQAYATPAQAHALYRSWGF